MRDLPYTVLTIMPSSLHGLTCILLAAVRQLLALVITSSFHHEEYNTLQLRSREVSTGTVLMPTEGTQSGLTGIKFIVHAVTD